MSVIVVTPLVLAEIRRDFGSKNPDPHFVHLFIDAFDKFIKSTSEIFIRKMYDAPKLLSVREKDDRISAEVEIRCIRPIPNSLLEEFKVSFSFE
jgi:hypothetical protein